MKTLNQYRNTNSICISGTIAGRIAKISAFCAARGESLIALANVPGTNDHEFAVRVIQENGDLVDLELDVWLDKVNVVGQAMICKKK